MIRCVCIIPLKLSDKQDEKRGTAQAVPLCGFVNDYAVGI